MPVGQTTLKDVTQMTTRQLNAELAYQQTLASETINRVGALGDTINHAEYFAAEDAKKDLQVVRAYQLQLIGRIRDLSAEIARRPNVVEQVPEANNDEGSCGGPVSLGVHTVSVKPEFMNARRKAMAASAISVAFLALAFLGIHFAADHNTIGAAISITVGLVGAIAARHFTLKFAGDALKQANGDFREDDVLMRWCFTSYEHVRAYRERFNLQSFLNIPNY